MDERHWTPRNVLLVILIVLVLAAIFISGWSFLEIIAAIVVIGVVVAAFAWLAQRNQAGQR